MGREANSELSRVDRAIRGSGQGFLGALKRKPLELDRHKIGAKIAAPGDYARRSHVAEGRVLASGSVKVRKALQDIRTCSPLASDRIYVISPSRGLSLFQKGLDVT